MNRWIYNVANKYGIKPIHVHTILSEWMETLRSSETPVAFSYEQAGEFIGKRIRRRNGTETTIVSFREGEDSEELWNICWIMKGEDGVDANIDTPFNFWHSRNEWDIVKVLGV